MTKKKMKVHAPATTIYSCPGNAHECRRRRKVSVVLIDAQHYHMSAVEHPLSRSCPFLDTIDRTVLDFDFEKLCSVSLSNNNVYACMVCGKYFQGGQPGPGEGKVFDFSLSFCLTAQVEASILMPILTVFRSDFTSPFSQTSVCVSRLVTMSSSTWSLWSSTVSLTTIRSLTPLWKTLKLAHSHLHT